MTNPEKSNSNILKEINTPQNSNLSTDQNLNFNEKNQKKYTLTTNKWRVKLYRLNENDQWDDNGVGYVFCTCDEKENKNNLVMIEEINGNEIFSIEINKNTADFHNQRGTIMTWKQDMDSNEDDTAISFQEKEGVGEILKNILINEGKNPDNESILNDENSEINYDVSLQNLPNLVREINIDIGEQKLINFINYLKRTNCEFIIELGELLKDEEKKIEILKKSSVSSFSLQTNSNSNLKDNSNKNIYKNLPMENIINIFNIFKNLISIGDRELLEILMDDNYYLITFGALEYDYETYKFVPHRNYFKEIVHFKNILNITDPLINKKINQNLRLNYLKDTALGRLIDDSTLKTINIMIQVNNNDIIQFLLYDNNLLTKLFKQMQSDDINIQKDSILFLTELIECSKTVFQSRITFNESLFEMNIISVLANILKKTKNDINNIMINGININEFIKVQSVEIFLNILSVIPNTILNYLKNDSNSIKILDIFKNLMCETENFGMKYEICQIYKILIETEYKEQSMNRLEFFSDSFIDFLKFLRKPLDIYNKNIISSTKQIILEILIHWFVQMNVNNQFWFTENKLNFLIPSLILEKSKIVNIYTIKLLKCIIEFTDPFVCNKIVTCELCENIIQLFKDNLKQNNLIISTLMNFFNFISQNNETVLNTFFTYQSDYFYENKNIFSKIILKYERKELPKKILINYNKTNEYKDIDPIFLNDPNEKEYTDCFFWDDEPQNNLLLHKRERDSDDEFNDAEELDYVNYMKKCCSAELNKDNYEDMFLGRKKISDNKNKNNQKNEVLNFLDLKE